MQLSPHDNAMSSALACYFRQYALVIVHCSAAMKRTLPACCTSYLQWVATNFVASLNSAAQHAQSSEQGPAKCLADKTHAVPVDLVPDSEEPGPQPEANSPHGMQQPSSPVQQQPGYSHADRGDAGKRAASPVREDSQHAEQEDVAAPYDTAQNAQAWESVRQHFAPGRTRHDRVSCSMLLCIYILGL